jgi:hypothetical protein
MTHFRSTRNTRDVGAGRTALIQVTVQRSGRPMATPGPRFHVDDRRRVSELGSTGVARAAQKGEAKDHSLPEKSA